MLTSKHNLNQAVWSEFYEDAFGFGKIISITKPIYYENGEYLIGVVGIDITFSRLR